MAVYGYVRVSTGRQATDGESLGVQEQKILGQAMIIGAKIDRIFVEGGVSGGKDLDTRPVGAELLSVLKRGDVVIASKLDRIFRDPTDALVVSKRFQKDGIRLYLIDMGGDVLNDSLSVAFFTMAAAFAGLELARIRERICEVKKDQHRRGRYLGGALPFGYRADDDGGLIPHAGEQAAIRRMVSLRSGGMALRPIAEAMKADGFALSHVAVGRVIKRAAL